MAPSVQDYLYPATLQAGRKLAELSVGESRSAQEEVTVLGVEGIDARHGYGYSTTRNSAPLADTRTSVRGHTLPFHGHVLFSAAAKER